MAGKIVTGSRGAGRASFRALVRSIGAIGNAREGNIPDAVDVALDTGIALQSGRIGSGLGVTDLAVHIGCRILKVLGVGGCQGKVADAAARTAGCAVPPGVAAEAV